MAFWKKGEDPWDRKPEKRKPTTQPEMPLKPPAWAQQKAPPPPMTCPWCGEEMTGGNLYSAEGRSTGCLCWQEGGYKSWLDRMKPQEQYLSLGCYEEAWYCAACQKLVLDVDVALKSHGPNYEWKDGKIVFPAEEEQDDL